MTKPLRHKRHTKQAKHRTPGFRPHGNRPEDAADSPRATLQRAGLKPKKSWGQNFLRDDSVLEAIASATGASPTQPVLELGAGLGALTRHLLGFGGVVVGVERDREIVPILQRDLAGQAGFRMLEADAASLDYAQLAGELGPLVVAGNLPYQLSSRILVNIADARTHVRRAVFMVQREVAERLCAQPDSRVYGLLTVLIQRAFSAEIVRVVPPGAFFPRPKVHSAVVMLTPHAVTYSPERERRLVQAARAAFSARRKVIKNALAGAFHADGKVIEAALHKAGIEAQARAENLGVPDFARLGDTLLEVGLLTPKAPADPT